MIQPRAIFLPITSRFEPPSGVAPDLCSHSDPRICADPLAAPRQTILDLKYSLTSRPARFVRPEGAREHDLIVYATGFHSSDFFLPMRVVGRQGLDLNQFWNGDAHAYLGGCVPGFPNFFSLFGPNTALVINGSIFFVSECGAHYIQKCLQTLRAAGHATMEVRPEAYERYTNEVDERNRRMVWGGISRVSSWYRNSFGRASQVWPFPLGDYWARTRSPDLNSFEFS